MVAAEGLISFHTQNVYNHNCIYFVRETSSWKNILLEPHQRFEACLSAHHLGKCEPMFTILSIHPCHATLLYKEQASGEWRMMWQAIFAAVCQTLIRNSLNNLKYLVILKWRNTFYFEAKRNYSTLK